MHSGLEEGRIKSSKAVSHLCWKCSSPAECHALLDTDGLKHRMIGVEKTFVSALQKRVISKYRKDAFALSPHV